MPWWAQQTRLWFVVWPAPSSAYLPSRTIELLYKLIARFTYWVVPANDKFRIYVCRWVKERSQCTGIIMGQRESNRKQHNLVVTCSKFISSRESKLLDPLPKVYIKPCSVKFHFMEWANGFVLVCFRSYRGWIFVAWVIGVKDIFNWTTNILTSPVISYSLAA